MLKQHLFIAALLLAPLAWLFGGALVCDEMFVYRDAAHYYYPLYRLVADNWAAGRVPLWNSQENLGQPLLADPTAAVLYPGKMIFASALGFDTNYKLYIIGHVFFAAVSSFAAARGFGRSLYAAALCALAYAYGGSVLFQYCNVVYLVGAAWLPLAALAIDRALRLRNWRWAIALGAVLAMMTLGGDPQCAYHAGLAAALYALIAWRTGRRAPHASTQLARRPHRALLLAAAALSLLVLAAAQILPTAAAARQSTRAAYDEPRNVYEAIASLRHDSFDDRWGFLAGRAAPGQRAESYDFSVGPWHIAGFFWPNIFGNIFPTNTRWINALPAEGRTWTPTLYLGLLPLVLAVSQLRLLHGRARLPPSQGTAQIVATSIDAVRIHWLSWLALLALVASFGGYSLGWLASEIYSAIYDGAEPPWGGPLGGIYWLLQLLLPGYAQFRYPAKWLVFVSLSLSLLSAYGWDAAVVTSGGRLRWLILAARNLSAIALCLAFGAWLWPPALELVARHTPHDRLFGPLDVDATRWRIVHVALHAVVISTLSCWLLLGREDLPPLGAIRRRGWQWPLLLVLTGVDLAWAQAPLIATASAESWRTAPIALHVIALTKEAIVDESIAPPRVKRMASPPPKAWAETSSTERPAIGQSWDRDTLLPKYHLLWNVEIISSSSALRAADVAEFQHALRRRGGPLVFEEYRMFPARGRDAVEYSGPSPRAWIVHEVAVLPPLAERHSDALWRRSNEVIALGSTKGFHAVAVVETDSQLEPLARPSGGASERCEIIDYSPGRVVVRANLAAPGLVVIADAYDPNWVCTVGDESRGAARAVPILRTNRILRGVQLPAGMHRLEFRYRPWKFYVGVAISSLGWIILVIAGSQRLALFLIARSKRKRRDVLRPG